MTWYSPISPKRAEHQLLWSQRSLSKSLTCSVLYLAADLSSRLPPIPGLKLQSCSTLFGSEFFLSRFLPLNLRCGLCSNASSSSKNMFHFLIKYIKKKFATQALPSDNRLLPQNIPSLAYQWANAFAQTEGQHPDYKSYCTEDMHRPIHCTHQISSHLSYSHHMHRPIDKRQMDMTM